MSRGTAAASANMALDDSGALESALAGADDIVVEDGESQPADATTDEQDGEDEDGTPSAISADAESEDGDEPDEQDDDTKRKLKVERRAKKQLEKRLQVLERELASVKEGTSQHLRTARDQHVDGVVGQTRSRVATLEQHVKAAQQARRDALESGDPDRIMQTEEQWFAAREQLGQARAIAQQAERQAAAIKQRPVEVSAAEPRQAADKADADSLAQQWVAKNKWFVDDPQGDDAEDARIESRLLVRAGIPPSDPRHWEKLTKRLRTILPHRFANQSADGKPKKNGAPRMAAASQRGGSSGPRREPDSMSPDSKAISRAEAEAWKIGRSMDIINNPEHRAEFLKQRRASRSSRGELFNG